MGLGTVQVLVLHDSGPQAWIRMRLLPVRVAGSLPVFLGYFFLLIISSPPELRKISLQVYVKKF